MEESQNQIIDNDMLDDEDFSKCIELTNNHLAAIEEGKESISIWSTTTFTKMKNINVNDMISDILLINSDYFVLSQPYSRKIFFYSTKNFAVKKILSNIDSCDCKHTFSMNKKYILVNCKNGFAIISIKNMEMIQYIENLDENVKGKCYRINDDNIIYYLFYENKENYLRKYNIFFQMLKLTVDKIEKIKKFKIFYDSEKYSLNADFFLCKNNKVLLNADEKILTLDENENF